jgi:Nitrile hydratase beta subunit
MARTHDMGGRPSDEPLNLEEHALADWEILADAVAQALGTKGIRTTDESRRAMEDMPAEEYLSLSYYERWIKGTERLLVEKGILTREEIEKKTQELEPTWDIS